MSGFDRNFPADNEYLTDFPAKQRQNQEVLLDGQVVNAGRLNGYKQGNANGDIPINNSNLNTNLNADMLDGKHSTDFAESGHNHNTATTTSAGFMSPTQVTKLNSIEANAEVNQNAFSNITIGATTIQADNTTDTLKLIAGTNIAITPDTTNDSITISVSGTVDKSLKDGNGNVITNTYTTKTEVDTALNSKADKATTLAGYGISNAYTKTEVDDYITGVGDTIAGYFGNQANKSPVYSSDGHLILPSGIELW